MEKEFAEPTWVVPELIPEGCTIIAGPAKKGKSYTMHHIGLAVAAGSQVFGKLPVERGHVLYLSLEGGEALFQERCRELLNAEEPQETFEVACETRTLAEGGLADLEEWIGRHRETARLIVVDTLEGMRDSMSGKDTGIWRADYDTVRGLSDLANAARIAIVVVVHTTKDPKPGDPFNEITGTMGLQGAADTLIVLRGPRGSYDSEIHATGRRLRAPVRAMTRWEPELGTISWLGDLDEAREGGQQGSVLEAIEAAAPESVTAKDLEELTGLDIASRKDDPLPPP